MRYAPKFELPNRPYLPGSGTRPLVSTVDGDSLPLTRANFRDHAGLATGLDLFNLGFYWEAHEMWERSWKSSEGAERSLMQALIQLAGMRLKLLVAETGPDGAGAKDGATTLRSRAQGHVEEARQLGAIVCGIDLDRLEADATIGEIRWLRRSRDLPVTPSELLVQPLECEMSIVDGGIAQALRTRSDYWGGNTLVLDRPIDFTNDDERAQFQARARQELSSSARYYNLYFETEGRVPAPTSFGKGNLDHLFTLRAQSVRSVPQPANIKMRPLIGDADWAAASELSCSLAVLDIGPNAIPFTKWRYEAFRSTVEHVGGDFYGAFDGDVITACLGTIPIGSAFRFQDVQTRVGYRRRGIARALCAYAFNYMKEKGYDTGIIAADANSMPQRLYESLGFEVVATAFQLRFEASEG